MLNLISSGSTNYCEFSSEKFSVRKFFGGDFHQMFDGSEHVSFGAENNFSMK